MRRVRLGDVCEVVSGSTPKTNVPEYWDGDKDWITPAELSDDSYVINDSVRKITDLGVQKTGLKSFPKGTVILSSRAPIGKVAIAGKSMYCNQGFKNLICSEAIIPEYLYWFLKGNTEYLNSLGRGATFKEISKKIVENIEIALPDKERQEHAVAVLVKCWEVMQKRKAELTQLDELIKARFVEMFGDRLINNRQWPTQKLGDCVSFSNGKAHEQVIDEDGEYVLVTSRAIASDFIDVRRTNSLLFPLKQNDIVMVMSDVPNGRALAKCQIIKEDNKYTLNQRICCFNNYDFDPIFLLYLLNRHQYFLSFNDGNGQTNLRKGDILECTLIRPPITLQQQFAEFVRQVDKSKAVIQKALDETQILFDSLMQEYFG